MRTAVLFLSLACLLTACGGGNKSDNSDNQLKERAKVAEANLVKLRDAVLAYYKKNGKEPASVSDLAGYGGGEKDLAVNDDYSELGYSFYNLKFDDDGKLTRGWFIATPMADRDALKVRMNGISGKFDYVKHDEDFGAAPDDPGWDNSEKAPDANGAPADNTPANNG